MKRRVLRATRSALSAPRDAATSTTVDWAHGASRGRGAPVRYGVARRGLLVLLLLCGAQFLAVLDATIVNVALPSVQRALHFTPQNLQWVASG